MPRAGTVVGRDVSRRARHHRGGVPGTRRRGGRSARSCSGRGLRRVGVFQARSTDAHRGGAGMAGTAPAFREAHRSPVGRRAGQALPGRPRPVVPRRSVARRLPRHRGAGWPDRARQPAAPGSRRAGRHHRRRRRCAAPASRARRAWSSKTGRRRPTAHRSACWSCRVTARWSSRSTASARTGAAPCAPRRPSRSASTRGSAAPSPPAGRPARARPGAARGVRELPAPARAAHGVEVHALGGVDAGRSRPHRAARRPGPHRSGRGLGASRAGRPGAVRAGERRLAGARGAHVRRLGARPRAPPTDLRRPRVPRVHAVPPGAPARPPRSRATSTCSPAGGGRCPPPCSRRSCPTRA